MIEDKSFKLSDLLQRYHLSLNKFVGQHFLADLNALQKVVEVAHVLPSDVVLEVGVGLGNLTECLAQKARHVYGIEIDPRLLRVAQEVLQGLENVTLIEGDALKLMLREALKDRPFPNKLVANLPYQVASPLLIQYLSSYPEIQDFTVMVQQEVGERIVALRESKAYGAFTLKVKYFATASLKAKFPPQVFIPPPKVNSALIKLKRCSPPEVSYEMFSRLVEAAFSHRRKTLLNSLVSSDLFFLGKDKIREVLLSLSIEPSRRGESLDFKEFVMLAEALGRWKIRY